MTNRVTASPSDKAQTTSVRFNRFLPRIGSPGYHLLLTAVAILILGPLGGISAAFMNFSIGFFIGGDGFARILRSGVQLRCVARDGTRVSRWTVLAKHSLVCPFWSFQRDAGNTGKSRHFRVDFRCRHDCRLSHCDSRIGGGPHWEMANTLSR